MGDMTVLITGAAGFVGRAAVAQARREGLRVVALVRRHDDGQVAWEHDEGITRFACDLSAPDERLAEVLAQADCVIHCAAALAHNHASDTLQATKHLLTAMPGNARLVHLSSIAVHDFASLPLGTIINETAPLERNPERRDVYASAKRRQEDLVSQAAAEKSLGLTILRPGAIFGPERLWNAHLGLRRGQLLFRFGRRGQIPLAHISTAAKAIIAAATRAPTAPIFLLDDDLPDRIRYLRALREGPRLILPVQTDLARLIWSRETCAARFRPFGFDNARMRVMLGVEQNRSFEDLMQEAQQ